MPEHSSDLDDFEAILAQMSAERREDLLAIARTMLDLDMQRARVTRIA